MASWTTPITHSTGDVLAVTDWNGVANNETFLYQAPYANYYNSSATSVPTGSNTQISLGGTTSSGYGFKVTSNSAIAPLTGIYAVSGALTMITSSGQVAVDVYLNGSAVSQASTNASTNGISVCTSTLVSCASTSTIGLYGYQNTGSSQNSYNAADFTYLAVHFVGSQ